MYDYDQSGGIFALRNEEPQTLKAEINRTDKEIDRMVYGLIAVILLFILFSYTNAFANPTKIEGESHIDNFPFNTEIRVNLIASPFNLNEESYIDDIEL